MVWLRKGQPLLLPPWPWPWTWRHLFVPLGKVLAADLRLGLLLFACAISGQACACGRGP